MCKKKLKRIVGAVLFFAVLYFAVYLTGVLVCHDDIWEHFYRLENDSVDVILVGASGMSRYYQFTQPYGDVGFTSYVLSSSDQPEDIIPVVIDEAMRSQNPELIVVETRKIIKGSGDFEQNLLGKETEMTEQVIRKIALTLMEQLSPVRLKEAFASKFSGKLDEVTGVILPVLENHDKVYQEGFTFKLEPLKDKYYGMADVKVKVDFSEQGEAQSRLKVDGIHHLDEASKTMVDMIAAKAAEYGKPLLFVSTPYIKTDELFTLQTELNQYLEEKGYDHLDCNEYVDEIGLDYSRDFYDTNHVNAVGANKFTQWFARYLDENYMFSKNHPEEIAEKWSELSREWNALYPEYEAAVNNYK